jgi:hypothetical protein
MATKRKSTKRKTAKKRTPPRKANGQFRKRKKS